MSESADLEMLKITVSTVVIGVKLLLLGTVSTSRVQLSKYSQRFFFYSLLAILGSLLCSSHVEPRVCVLQWMTWVCCRWGREFHKNGLFIYSAVTENFNINLRYYDVRY